MKKIFTLFLMALSLSAFAQKKVAVYMTGNDPVNKIIGNRLVDGLAKNGQYTAIERSASFLKAMSKEHSYEREGAVDDNEIAELGRQFGVQYVCVASILNVWQNEKYITARIIDAESAEVVATGSSNGSITNPDALVGAMNGLSESLLKTLDYNKNADAKKVAVYVSRTGNRDVDIILGDQLVSGFARSGKYLAIERTNSFLSQLAKEQGYQQSGAVDDEDLIRLGKQFGVQYVCVAEATSWGGSYFISARLINVTTAEIVNSYNAENKKLGNSQDVVNVASEMATKLSGMTINEKNEYITGQTKNYENAKKSRIQQFQDKKWIDLISKVTKNVTHKYVSGCTIGDLGATAAQLWYWYDNSLLFLGSSGDSIESGFAISVPLNGDEIKDCPNGWVYVGPRKNWKKQGDNGRIYDWNGDLIYYGSFENGNPTGEYPMDSISLSKLSNLKFKVITTKQGDMYIGETFNEEYSGMGLYISKNGDAYYGGWRHNIKNGGGLFMKFSGAYVYEEWIEGKKNVSTGEHK